MIVAELVLRHTRRTSPTRRLVVQRFAYPEDAAPFAPGILLGGIVAACFSEIDPVLRRPFDDMIATLDAGGALPQRALRHRVQTDRVGLDRSDHRLVVSGEVPVLQVDRHGPPLAQLVGALAALGTLGGTRRRRALACVRRAREVEWTTGARVAGSLLADADARVLAIRHRRGATTEEERALEVLGFGIWERPTRSEVTAAFRRLVRDAHPDHGATADGAGRRVATLDAARRLLLRD